jgi:hypothetical protein
MPQAAQQSPEWPGSDGEGDPDGPDRHRWSENGATDAAAATDTGNNKACAATKYAVSSAMNCRVGTLGRMLFV